MAFNIHGCFKQFYRAYFNMLTAGANDPAVICFAPAVITFASAIATSQFHISLEKGTKMANNVYVMMKMH